MTTNHDDGTVDDLNDQGQVSEQQSNYVEIDGQQVDLEEVKKGYMRQSDYTKKTQELAREKESMKTQGYQWQSWDEDWVKQAEVFVEWILERYGLKDLPKAMKVRELDESFDKIASYSPEIKAQERAIKKLAETEWISIEDVISNYGFLSNDKLEKARNSRPLVWRSGVVQEDKKSWSQLSPKEREEAKKSGRVRLVSG